MTCAFYTVVVLMLVGMWLERIGGKHGVIDELFAPIPLGSIGILWSVFIVGIN